jgi:hypothetical protein
MLEHKLGFAPAGRSAAHEIVLRPGVYCRLPLPPAPARLAAGAVSAPRRADRALEARGVCAGSYLAREPRRPVAVAEVVLICRGRPGRAVRRRPRERLTATRSCPPPAAGAVADSRGCRQPVWRCRCARRRLAPALPCGRPATRVPESHWIVGVTGTDGKTTNTTLGPCGARAAGRPTAAGRWTYRRRAVAGEPRPHHDARGA